MSKMAVNDIIVKKNFKPSLRTKNKMSLLVKIVQTIYEDHNGVKIEWQWTRTTDTQWRHKSKKSENLGRCGRQNMLRSYLKIWEWELIFVRAVKAISSPGVCIPCQWPYNTFIHILSIPYIYNEAKSFLRYLRIIPLCSSTFIRFKNSDNVFRNYRIL